MVIKMLKLVYHTLRAYSNNTRLTLIINCYKKTKIKWAYKGNFKDSFKGIYPPQKRAVWVLLRKIPVGTGLNIDLWCILPLLLDCNTKAHLVDWYSKFYNPNNMADS